MWEGGRCRGTTCALSSLPQSGPRPAPGMHRTEGIHAHVHSRITGCVSHLYFKMAAYISLICKNVPHVSLHIHQVSCCYHILYNRYGLNGIIMSTIFNFKMAAYSPCSKLTIFITSLCFILLTSECFNNPCTTTTNA